MKKWLNVAILVVIGAALLYAIVPQFSKKEELKKQAVIEQPEQQENRYAAADFTLPTLAGDAIQLSDSRGKLTIINFWASWCGPCKEEAPHLQTFYDKHHDEIELLAVNVTAKDKIDDVKAFVKEYNLTFPVLLDETGDVSMTYGAFTIPTTIFLNEYGEIVHEVAGPLSEQYLYDIIDTLQ